MPKMQNELPKKIDPAKIAIWHTAKAMEALAKGQHARVKLHLVRAAMFGNIAKKKPELN